ncbi:hypothetical protein DM02DRAFT_706238 [Periconia macrospinosa]|uniref:Zinc finger PHD-type domain-containing protein n=1 Tax=Periconia macrospinosa TaxID=97972 RepID=A0A2V1DSI7_9PLEO|nr:hypothetical protein DM02DRAFT_706238 [Periconia macrospinosa]
MADEKSSNDYVWSSSSSADSSQDGETVDIPGTKHVDKEAADDMPYHLSGELTIYRFTDTERMQGAQSSIRSMRQYITSTIPPQLIQNEHGESTPIHAIFSGHLPRLQATIWREWPQMVAQLSIGEDQTISPKDIGTVKAVASIADILEGGYVMILDKCCPTPPGTQNTCDCVCSFPVCEQVHAESDSIRTPYKISLEPLVDWKTLDVVEDDDNIDKILGHSSIIVYRRNLELWYDTLFNFQRYIPEKGSKVTLCLECLKYLWDGRIHSWYLMRKYATLFASSNDEDAQSIWRAPNHDAQEKEEVSSFSSEVEDTSEEESSEDEDSTRYSSEDAIHSSSSLAQDQGGDKKDADEDGQVFSMSDLSVNQDSISNQDIHHYISGTQITTNTNREPSQMLLDGAGDRKRRTREPSFSIWDEYPTLSTTGGTGIQPSGSSAQQSAFIQSSEAPTDSHLAQQSSTPSDRLAKKRYFGCYLDNNSIAEATPSESFAPPSPGSSTNMRQLLLPFTPLPPTQTLLQQQQSNRNVQPAPSANPPARSSYSFNLPVRTRYTQPLQRPLAPRLITPRPFAPNIPLQTRPLAPKFSTSQPLQTIRYPKPWPFPKLNLNAIPSSPSSQPTTPSPPPSPTTHGKEEEEEHQRMQQGYPPMPSPTQTICTCRRPALLNDIKTKSNTSGVPGLSQCHNPECRISWFHYTCLDRSSKISSCHGRWICDVCKGERSWLGFQREVPKDGVKKLDAEDFERVVQKVKDGKKALMSWKGDWTGESMCREVDALFGGAGESDPYGLATMWKEVDAVKDAGVGVRGETGTGTGTETSPTPPPPPESPRPAFGDLPTAAPYWISRAYSENPLVYGPEFVALDVARFPSEFDTLFSEEEEDDGNEGYYYEDEDFNGEYFYEDLNGQYYDEKKLDGDSYEEEQDGGECDHGVDRDGGDEMEWETSAGFRNNMESVSD